MTTNLKQKSGDGIAMLVSVLIISSVALAIVIGFVLMSLTESKMGIHRNKMIEIFAATDSCIDDALVKLNGNHGYAGEVFNYADIACTINVSGSGATRTLNANSTYEDTYAVSAEVLVNLDPFTVETWELTD